MVECQLPKLDVAGSSPVARSLELFPRLDFGRRGGFRLRRPPLRSNVPMESPERGYHRTGVTQVAVVAS